VQGKHEQRQLDAPIAPVPQESQDALALQRIADNRTGYRDELDAREISPHDLARAIANGLG